MNLKVKIATLHPEYLLEYERLHRQVPEINVRHMTEGGYQRMQILRSGNTVIMLLECDEGKDIKSLSEFAEAAEAWRKQTEPCFATPWQDANEIYRFTVQISVQTK
jgi:L-rhamnose mutarotase